MSSVDLCLLRKYRVFCFVTVTAMIVLIFLCHVSNKNFSHLFFICKNTLVKFNEIEQQDAECSECEIVIKDSPAEW